MTSRNRKIMNTMSIASIALNAFVFLNGCGRQFGNVQEDEALWDSPHTIRQYNGGTMTGEWTTVGRVISTGGGYYFRDAKTNKMVTVSGDIQLTLKGAELSQPTTEVDFNCSDGKSSVTTTGDGSAAVVGNGNVIRH